MAERHRTQQNGITHSQGLSNGAQWMFRRANILEISPVNSQKISYTIEMG